MLRDLLRRAAKRLPPPAARVVARLAESDAMFLLRTFLTVAAVWIFVAVAGEVREGETREIDEMVIRAFRDNADPNRLAGPEWLEGVVRDLTALGSSAVLTLFTSAVAVFLAVRRQYHALALVVVAALGGLLLADGLKAVFQRPRPDLVPHLARVYTTSFPSGHAVSSACVYLTLGALMSRLVEERKLKAYFLGLACFITFLVGLSRVVLGVHYPSDVLAGWSAGLAWALLCWMTASYLQRRGKVEPPK
jgi:undecaprenyl-diphosphatase